MAIVPDTKDWTWVLERPCDECGFDARSAERLYVRVDKDRSYLLYGDFQTGDNIATQTGVDFGTQAGQRVLGTYNRTATGLGWHFENARVRGNVFAIEDSLRQVIDSEIDGASPLATKCGAITGISTASPGPSGTCCAPSR